MQTMSGAQETQCLTAVGRLRILWDIPFQIVLSVVYNPPLPPLTPAGGYRRCMNRSFV